MLHEAHCGLVHPVVDDGGPVIGKLRTADFVKQSALAGPIRKDESSLAGNKPWHGTASQAGADA
jgi:hypothetical protein